MARPRNSEAIRQNKRAVGRVVQLDGCAWSPKSVASRDKHHSVREERGGMIQTGNLQSPAGYKLFGLGIIQIGRCGRVAPVGVASGEEYLAIVQQGGGMARAGNAQLSSARYWRYV